MKIPTLAVIYDRKKKAAAAKPATVELRMTFDGKQRYLSTGISVLPQHWDKKNCQVKGRPDAAELNKILMTMKRRALELLEGMVEHGSVDVDALSLALRDNKSGSFIDYVALRAEKRPVRNSTKQHYYVFMKALKEWGRIKTFGDITKQSIKDWADWLLSPDRNKGKGYSKATICNYHKYMKEFINEAVADDYISCNPYQKLRMKIDRGEKDSIDYLTEEQVKKISSLHIVGEGLIRARDLFLFQCFTGLAYSDMMRFDINDYRKIDGKWFSADEERLKTNTTYYLQLLTPAVKILEKYSYKLPRIDNASYNMYLKTIGALIGVGRLHSHMGRSTFATLMLSKGMREEHVAKALGHTSTRQTRRYATLLAKDVRDDFTKVDELL